VFFSALDRTERKKQKPYYWSTVVLKMKYFKAITVMILMMLTLSAAQAQKHSRHHQHFKRHHHVRHYHH